MLSVYLNITKHWSVRIIKFGPNVIQTATLTGRQTRGGPLKLPKPFPYEDRRYRWFYEYWRPTILNVCEENARVIVVDGPIGVGKTAFCQKLAEEFDMRYFPQVTMDIRYITPDGVDLRDYDNEIPEKLRTYDHKNFCTNPKTARAGFFQIQMMHLRFFQYMDCLAHLLNTGQGVILERSYFSDYVFMKAMREQKYVSKEVAKAYFTIRENTAHFFMPPHLLIYLDIPVPVVQERIRTRNYSYECNSPALTTAYLESLEKYYKEDYLMNARKKGELLVYDWTDGGDVDVVIDDIEKIDFDIVRKDQKFQAWWLSRGQWFNRRYWFTNKFDHYNKYFYYPWHEIDEFFVDNNLLLERNKVYSQIPGLKYDIGYNPLVGDSFWNIFFGTTLVKHRHNRLHLNYSLLENQ